MSEQDKNEIYKMRNQFIMTLAFGLIGFIASQVILAKINATEISNIKSTNQAQDAKIIMLEKETLQKNDFERMFQILREDIKSLKQDIDRKADKYVTP